MLYDLEQLSTPALAAFESAIVGDLCGLQILTTDHLALRELCNEGLAYDIMPAESGYRASLTPDGFAAHCDWMPIPLPRLSNLTISTATLPSAALNDNEEHRAAA